jgi:hypothetical protein
MDTCSFRTHTHSKIAATCLKCCQLKDKDVIKFSTLTKHRTELGMKRERRTDQERDESVKI